MQLTSLELILILVVGIANINEQGFVFPNAFKMRSNIYVVDTIGIQKVLNRDKLYIIGILHLQTCLLVFHHLVLASWITKSIFWNV